jgi:hypothetical protein
MSRDKAPACCRALLSVCPTNYRRTTAQALDERLDQEELRLAVRARTDPAATGGVGAAQLWLPNRDSRSPISTGILRATCPGRISSWPRHSLRNNFTTATCSRKS